jgi:hypothetical protein
MQGNKFAVADEVGWGASFGARRESDFKELGKSNAMQVNRPRKSRPLAIILRRNFISLN